MIARCLLALVVLLAACTSGEPAEIDQPARLIFADGDGGISMWTEDSGAITRVSGRVEGSQPAQPIWSSSGRFVSWARLDPSGAAYVIHDLETGEDSVFTTDSFPFYAYWSPDDEQVVILRNGPTSVVVELIDVGGGRNEVIDRGAPYYLSWNPDGGEFVAHIGETTLAVVDLEGGRRSIGPTDSGYIAPFWTTGGVFHIERGALTRVVDDDREAMLQIRGRSQFVVTADGSKVALQQLTDGPGQSIALEELPSPPGNALIVHDFDSGEQSVAHEEPVFGFSWSPDGENLLFHSLAGDELAANVWKEGESREFVGYRPAPTLIRDLFPFFPQYAQSMSMWSPDSESFVVVGDLDGRTGIWVQDLADVEPTFVAEGSWASWSP